MRTDCASQDNHEQDYKIRTGVLINKFLYVNVASWNKVLTYNTFKGQINNNSRSIAAGKAYAYTIFRKFIGKNCFWGICGIKSD